MLALTKSRANISRRPKDNPTSVLQIIYFNLLILWFYFHTDYILHSSCLGWDFKWTINQSINQTLYVQHFSYRKVRQSASCYENKIRTPTSSPTHGTKVALSWVKHMNKTPLLMKDNRKNNHSGVKMSDTTIQNTSCQHSYRAPHCPLHHKWWHRPMFGLRSQTTCFWLQNYLCSFSSLNRIK